MDIALGRNGAKAGRPSFFLAPEISLYILLTIAVVLGGGGVGAGLLNLVVQLAAIIVLAINRERVFAFFRHGPRALVWLVACSFALPILQLVPLPPAIWSAMPGRDLVARSLDLLEAADTWQPLSVDVNRTAVALLGLLPALAAAVLVWRMPKTGRTGALRAVVYLGVLCVIQGAMQLASGDAIISLHDEASGDVLYGTFANRNSAGLFLVIALIALLGQQWSGKGGRVAKGTLAAIFVIAVVLTESRSSMALLVVPAALFAWQHFRSPRDIRPRGRDFSYAAIAIAGVLTVGATAILISNQRVDEAAARFSNFDDLRFKAWEDGRVVAQRYWPVGSGTGTFDEVFQVDESLEHVIPQRMGRAHSDLLELVIESGILGLLLLAVWLVWFLRASLAAFFERRSSTQMAASCWLLVLFLQSLVDYPLRNEALLCIAGVMAALLAEAGTIRAKRGTETGAGK